MDFALHTAADATPANQQNLALFQKLKPKLQSQCTLRRYMVAQEHGQIGVGGTCHVAQHGASIKHVCPSTPDVAEFFFRRAPAQR